MIPAIIATLSLIMVVSVQAEAAFIPSTQFLETVAASVVYDSKARTFSYSYSVGNAPGSKQSIARFGVGYTSSGLGSIRSPAHWDSYPDFSDMTMAFWYVVGRDQWSISPGTTLHGFRMSHSGLPSIRAYFMQSSYQYSPQSEEEVDQIEREELGFFINNCKRGKTVGPGSAQSGKASDQIAYLIQQKHLAEDHGWITSAGIVRSLDAKLDAAQAAINRNQPETATHQIKAFEHELDAQQGKALNLSAHALREANAQYLLELLAK